MEKLTCFVDDRKKLCFVNIPKNASSSVRTTLHLKHAQYSDVYKDYNKIIVIRDPMIRAISSFNEVIKLRRDGPFRQTARTQFYKYRSNIEKSFDLFLDYVKNHMYDNHVIPQYLFFTEKGLKIEDFKHVILFENLEQELQNIIQHYKLNYNKINHAQVGNSNIKRVLIGVIGKYKSKIMDIYREDFELYEELKNKIDL